MKTISVAIDCLPPFLSQLCVFFNFSTFCFSFLLFFCHFVFPRSLALLFICLSVRPFALLVCWFCAPVNILMSFSCRWPIGFRQPPIHTSPPALPRPCSSHMSLWTSQVVVKLIKYSRRKYHRASRGSSWSFVYTKKKKKQTRHFLLSVWSIFKWVGQPICTNRKYPVS